MHVNFRGAARRVLFVAAVTAPAPPHRRMQKRPARFLSQSHRLGAKGLSSARGPARPEAG